MYIQVARVPRIIHFMFQKFIEEAYERHLKCFWRASERFISLRRHMRGIWEAYISLRKHMRGISHWVDIWEASGRHISLRRCLRGIWEAYLIEETSERHLRSTSHWGDIWEAHERHISLRKPGCGNSVYHLLISKVLCFNILQNKHIKSVVFWVHGHEMYQFLRGSFSEIVLPLS